jgi:hypothetical protein
MTRETSIAAPARCRARFGENAFFSGNRRGLDFAVEWLEDEADADALAFLTGVAL